MVNDKHEILLSTSYIEQNGKKFIAVDDLILILQDIIDEEDKGYQLRKSALLGYFIRLRGA
jgi:hypothetical protein